MSSKLLSRREFSARLAASVPLAVAGGFTLEKISRQAGSMDSGGLSHSAGAIHQEVVFKANRKRVYEALTDAAQFTSVTKFSMVKDVPPAEISREPGGAFACFGGYISGRHVELKPDERIVQAWRAGSWNEGVYSIARFELQDQGENTKLVFDHTGFPNDQGEHLAAGWKQNYWEPLARFLET
jgi:uncharacterized protein YndB with AHSA1/START domain